MSIFEAIFLGIVQGLTEFLPVSSSGHLVLFRQIFGINEPPLLFDSMVHVGTLVAVFAVLWKDVLGLLKKPIQPMMLYLIIGTVPAVVAGLLFTDWLEAAFETGRFIGFAFLGTAALLVTAELLSRRAQRQAPGEPGKMNWLDALAVGLCQAVAVIPGLSRSGATMSGALSRGLDRDLAARFSFLLSIPIILGAAVFQLRNIGDSAAGGVAATGGIGPAQIAAGSLTAALVGFFAVRLMLKIIREKSLFGFAVYTGILGFLVILDQTALHLVF